MQEEAVEQAKVSTIAVGEWVEILKLVIAVVEKK